MKSFDSKMLPALDFEAGMSDSMVSDNVNGAVRGVVHAAINALIGELF